MTLSEQVRERIRSVEDFPKPGVVFEDITPLLADGSLFERVTDWMVERFRSERPTHVLAIESRGFIFGSPVAHRLGAGLVPVRKPGKLPWTTVRVTYDLEYGRDALEIHADALRAGDRVLIVDDLLATGGTAAAACTLVENLGAEVVGLCVAVELTFLEGRGKLEGRRVEALVRF
ncbi:MAG: adenine phosphoribosyltransferase [Planctomycetota bacterium]